MPYRQDVNFLQRGTIQTRGTGHKIGCHLQQEIFHQTAQHKRALLDDDLDKVEKSTIISLTNTMKSASCIPETLEERTHQGYPDLQGVQLRVITDPWPPYIIKSAHANGSYYVTGFSLDLLEEVRQLLNFTYVLEYEHDGWGQTCEDGNWSGMVGLLQRREKDLIIGALGHQPERTAVMDFSLIYDEISITMWILDPRQRPRIWLALFDMLDLAVTGLLLGTICLLSVILTLSSMTVPIGHQPESLTSCFVTKVFTLLGAILAQGSRVQQATSTGKTIIATWWMFSVVFSITYSAMLIASLSANTTQLPFDSVASMIKQTEYSYGIFGSGTEQMYFKVIPYK
ncbi:glutamate receptor ionotropic, kainate glr-3-like [Liolophura sinensis]|uniref:glutamate receptor ionotropic, kainate glr-3-like n=1 Tax=Liolophura sinensis TaxID=3198878 RepID=UPI0031594243